MIRLLFEMCLCIFTLGVLNCNRIRKLIQLVEKQVKTMYNTFICEANMESKDDN